MKWLDSLPVLHDAVDPDVVDAAAAFTGAQPSLWQRLKAACGGWCDAVLFRDANDLPNAALDVAPPRPQPAPPMAAVAVKLSIRISIGNGPITKYGDKDSAIGHLRVLGMRRDDARNLVNKVCDTRSVFDKVLVDGVGCVYISCYRAHAS